MTPNHVEQIAIEMAQEKGLENLSRSTVCARAGIPPGSFAHVTGMSFKALIRKLADAGHGKPNAEVTRRRIDPKLRRASIVSAAVRVAERVGLDAVTRDAVAEEAGVKAVTVSKYFNTMPQLKRAVRRASEV